MILHIYDTGFSLLGLIDSCISLQWTEDYCARGVFTLVLPDSDENIRLLRQGRYAAARGKRTAMVIRSVCYDSGARIIEVHGYTTLDLLCQRVVFPTQSVEQAEDGMYALTETNAMGGRAIPYLTTARLLGGLQGYPHPFEAQFTGDSLTDALSSVAAESGLGFFMGFEPKNKRHVFTVYKGADRTWGGQGEASGPPVVFAAEYGNLSNVIILDDMSLFRNTAYVLGMEEDDGSRLYAEAGAADGLDRFELFVDGKGIKKRYRDERGVMRTLTNAQYLKLLYTAGLEKLNERVHAQSFTGEVGIQGFGTDYYLGDRVTCVSGKYRTRLDARILRYTEVTENNMTRLSLTLGHPEISILDEVRAWKF